MNIQALYEELDTLYGQGDPKRVLSFLKDKKALAASLGSVDLVIWANNELGSLYRGMGLFDESEAAFLEAIAALSEAGDARAEELAISYNNLGGTYRMAGRQEEALHVFKKAMALYAALLDFDNYGYASTFNNLALVFLSLGQEQAALEYLSQAAVAMRARALFLPLAISLTNLSMVVQALGRLEEARAYLEEAEAIFASRFPGDYHQAACLAARGQLQAKAGDADSILSYQEAAEIIKSHYGESHEYQMMHKNIALLLKRFGPGACKFRGTADETREGAVCE